MSRVEAIVLREPADVAARLAELQLDLVSLLRIRAKALSAGADATPFHAANAAGTLAYQQGTFALRDEYVGKDWQVDRQDGVEAIRNDDLKIKVVFANVDVACDDEQKPKPRSPKGAGTERVCIGNLFGTLPEYAPRQVGGWRVYYLMVDDRGAAELTLTVVRKGTFVAWPERMYLSDGSDLDRMPPLSLDDGDIADDFDPQVVRK